MAKKKGELVLINQKKRHPYEYDINANGELVQEFFLRVAGNEATTKILKSEPKFKENKGKKFFCAETFYKLMLHHEEFRELYYNAKAVGAEMAAEAMLEIADTCNGKSSAEVQKARLMVDTRKFIAMSLLPKRYGTAVKVDQKVTEEKVVGSDQLDAIAQKVKKQMGGK